MVLSYRTTVRSALVAVSMAASFATLAADPTEAQLSNIRRACSADYEKVCAAVPPGGAGAIDCLKQNILKVSQSCQVALAAVGPGSAQSARAPDRATAQQKTAAGTTTPVPAAAAKAASAPTPAPTPAPAAVASMPSMMTTRPPEGGAPSKVPYREEVEIARDACGPEYRQYCPMVRPGGGRALSCLAANEASLPPACRKLVAEAIERMK